MNQEHDKDKQKDVKPNSQPGENMPAGAEHQTAERNGREKQNRPANEPGREQEEVHNSAV